MRRDKPWMLWENEVCRRLGIDRVVASGATDNYKGDCKGGAILVDCKHTTHGAYRLTSSMWGKLASWARNESRVPVLAVRTCVGDVVAVPEWWYCEKGNVDTSGIETDARKSVVMSGAVTARPGCDHVVGIGNERIAIVDFEWLEEAVADEA